ncbi:hypothetical protein EDD86DRAFT_245773 [Gorgonomyces haynaldii]|nr:hypothetical protein EDD86DRAFT_245773 [Gorgonomyces haynaldii]
MNLDLLVKEQEQELLKLKQQIHKSQLNQLMKKKVSFKAKDEDPRIRVLEEQMEQFREYQYQKELQNAQELETLRELLESKSQRIKALEKTEPVNSLLRDNAEIRMLKYQSDKQQVEIQRLKLQLDKKVVTRDQETQTESKEKIDAQMKLIMEHIQRTTLELLQSLELVDPETHKKLTLVQSKGKERLSLINKGFEALNDKITTMTAQIQELEKKKLVLEQEIDTSQRVSQNMNEKWQELFTKINSPNTKALAKLSQMKQKLQSVKSIWEFIQNLHLDREHGLLNAKSLLLVYELFNTLDWRKSGGLDDITFICILQHATDLSVRKIYKIFELFDLDGSGSVEFNEFYLLVCILVAVNDKASKNFMFRNWRTCFEILDADGSGAVSKEEFETLGFLFNFSSNAIKRIYDEFDELDRDDFQLFVLAAIDLQQGIDIKHREMQRKMSEIYTTIKDWIKK